MELRYHKWTGVIAAVATVSLLPPAQAALTVGKPAPRFALKRLQGRSTSLARLRGKVVLLDFWMPGCPPCEVEAPHLQRLHKKYYAGGLRIVGMTQTDPPPAAVRDFIKRHGLTYPLLMDKGMKVATRYQVETHPYGVLIDRKGIVRYIHPGFLQGEEKQLEAAIRAVLAGRPVPKE
ncbi:MAG: TlpA family protein disulfide reductase [Armatimonadota bacterium]|nr:TlpA family protein disulfide reductase [Armatimonadota bacterium]